MDDFERDMVAMSAWFVARAIIRGKTREEVEAIVDREVQHLMDAPAFRPHAT